MSEKYTAQGAIKIVNETQSFATSDFTKREFVITTEADTDYPQDIKFAFTKDKCAILDKYAVGQEVIVSFNMRGNEYNGKYYVNLQAWKIEGLAGQAQPQQQQQSQPAQQQAPPQQGEPSNEDLMGQDIPF